MNRIQMRTGARLHFGLILGNPEDGWQFGGIGLMVRRPGWHVEIQRAAAAMDEVLASAEATSRIVRVLSQLRENATLPPLKITVSSEIPFHTGLGGGTQLAIGIASACLWLCNGQRDLTAVELAQKVGRSERSAIGTFGFDHGGFLVDQGATVTGDRVQRVSIPDAWKFVLIRPVAGQGMSGADEQSWFGARPEMSSALIRELSQLATLELFTAVQNEAFSRFAEGLELYGDTAGRFYARAQGDIFSSPVIRSVVAELRRVGIRGAAQSSWGPGICIPAESEEHAEHIVSQIPKQNAGAELSVVISEAQNSGATLLTEAAAPQKTLA